MKDIILTGKRQKIEIITMLVCFLIANLLNLYSIINYKTSYLELITSLGYVVVAAAVLYAVWTIIRLIVYGVMYLFRRKKA